MSVISRRTEPQRAQSRHTPGEEGVWVFILGDMVVFAVFFATYLFYRGQQPDLFITGQQTLSQTYGVINTLLLLTSSLFVVMGVRGLRSRARVAPWLFAASMVCGFGFAVVKFLEYSAKLAAGVTPATNDFYMYYFVLTGLHFFHLLLGMVVLAFLVRLARKPVLTDRQFGFVEGGACFWHMVDLLWIVLFPLLYLIK
ncbi:cytochrome c oxidase subunit 3 [Pseudonocardia spinosispora]|uniref:cytochrome c oxidase subunit 3 n=1 Tax=Pseudonocardia spinosispora TaxID=103441 RepID=UPI00048EA767|nr:cytochrome c oxidase subunit 3 [Pseudonocardia spinosispora]